MPCQIVVDAVGNVVVVVVVVADKTGTDHNGTRKKNPFYISP